MADGIYQIVSGPNLDNIVRSLWNRLQDQPTWLKLEVESLGQVKLSVSSLSQAENGRDLLVGGRLQLGGDSRPNFRQVALHYDAQLRQDLLAFGSADNSLRRLQMRSVWGDEE